MEPLPSGPKPFLQRAKAGFRPRRNSLRPVPDGEISVYVSNLASRSFPQTRFPCSSRQSSRSKPAIGSFSVNEPDVGVPVAGPDRLRQCGPRARVGGARVPPELRVHRDLRRLAGAVHVLPADPLWDGVWAVRVIMVKVVDRIVLSDRRLLDTLGTYRIRTISMPETDGNLHSALRNRV